MSQNQRTGAGVPASASSSLPTLMKSLSQRLLDELTDAFRKFDLDDDGRITKAELVAVLKQLGLDLSEEDVDSMMLEADIDGDGGIDLHEFLRINAAAEDLEIEDDSKLLKEVFEVFDKDKNGFISAEELRDALTYLVPGGKPVTVDECRQMIKRVDANGDGVVDFLEFQKMMSSSDLLPCSS